MASPTLRFITWNTRGVVSKLNLILETLIKQNAEIVFLQETHIGTKKYKKLEKIEGWKSFYTVYDPRSKGVAFLIKDGVKFEYICHDEDYSGGYLVLFCYIHGELYTLVNVYNHKHDKDILKRLQDYLRETAEGWLVVGGDFNTVLDLTLDTKKRTGHTSRHTPLRGVFEKFTTSLNLKDTWAHLHPREKAFTRSQGDSFSRLDMILVPEDIIERVSRVKILEAPSRNGTTKKISDHDLVVLNLTCSQSSKKLPKVAKRLSDHVYSRDGKAGKINGAEILSVINSLTDSGQEYPDGNSIQTFKTHRCEYTESLKKTFNEWLDNGQIPDEYKQNTCTTGTRKIFTVTYLIFTMILAKRLTMLLLDPPNETHTNEDCFIVTLGNLEKIRQTFLKKILSHLCEIWKGTQKKKHRPQGDFRILEALGLPEDLGILDNILPKVTSDDNSSTDEDSSADEYSSTDDNTSTDEKSSKDDNISTDEYSSTDDYSSKDDYRELQEGCPLTRSIRSLVMKYLEIHIKKNAYKMHNCQFRQFIVCHTIPPENLKEKLTCLEWFKDFRKSRFELNILKID